jgi:hypothetical protein
VNALEKARAEREDRAINLAIDTFIEERIKEANLAAPISAHAKVKLRGILRKYAREDHPFRACVRDNTKRFGPGRVEAVCATLKDTIRGNKNWRGKGKMDKGSAGLADDLAIDADVLLALDAISEVDLQTVMLEARALEEHGSASSVSLLGLSGADELARVGAGLNLQEQS